jgi:hypothetical protein
MWRPLLSQWFGDTALALVVLNVGLMTSGLARHPDTFAVAGDRLLLLAPVLALIAVLVAPDASSRRTAQLVLLLYGVVGAFGVFVLRTF